MGNSDRMSTIDCDYVHLCTTENNRSLTNHTPRSYAHDSTDRIVVFGDRNVSWSINGKSKESEREREIYIYAA